MSAKFPFFTLMTCLREIVELYLLTIAYFLQNLVRTLNRETEGKD